MWNEEKEVPKGFLSVAYINKFTAIESGKFKHFKIMPQSLGLLHLEAADYSDSFVLTDWLFVSIYLVLGIFQCFFKYAENSYGSICMRASRC